MVAPIDQEVNKMIDLEVIEETGDETCGEERCVVVGWQAHPQWVADRYCPGEAPETRVVLVRWWDVDGEVKGGNAALVLEEREGEKWYEDTRPVNILGCGDPNDPELYEAVNDGPAVLAACEAALHEGHEDEWVAPKK